MGPDLSRRRRDDRARRRQRARVHRRRARRDRVRARASARECCSPGSSTGPGRRGSARLAPRRRTKARAWVNRYHDAGFDQIKIYSSVTLDVLRAITAEAHRLGMTVTGHVPDGMNAFTAIDAGLDQINHAEYLGDAADSDPQEVIAALKQHRTVIDPTLALYELLARPLNAADRDVRARHPQGRARARDAARTASARRSRSAARQRARLERRAGAGRPAAPRRRSDRRRHRPVGARPQPAPRDRALREGRLLAARRAAGGDDRAGARR